MSIENTTVHNMTSDRLAVARAAAKLKREKKAAAVIACKKGKERAAEEREMEQQRWLSFMDEFKYCNDKKYFFDPLHLVEPSRCGFCLHG